MREISTDVEGVRIISEADGTYEVKIGDQFGDTFTYTSLGNDVPSVALLVIVADRLRQKVKAGTEDGFDDMAIDLVESAIACLTDGTPPNDPRNTKAA